MTHAKEHSRQSNCFRLYIDKNGHSYHLCMRIREAKWWKDAPCIRYENNRPVAYRGDPKLIFNSYVFRDTGQLAVWCYDSHKFIPITRLKPEV